jgi:hypothetical protein
MIKQMLQTGFKSHPQIDKAPPPAIYLPPLAPGYKKLRITKEESIEETPLLFAPPAWVELPPPDKILPPKGLKKIRRGLEGIGASPIAPLQNRTPYILPQTIRDAWPGYCSNGNVPVTYGLWSLTADPTWWQYRSIDSCIQAFWQTGDQQYLDEAASDYLMMPLVSDSVHVGHLYELYYVIRYLILEPYLIGTYKSKQLEWDKRLNTLAQQMLSTVRVGDVDQCETYLEYWKILDKYFATNYASQTNDVSDWLDEFYQPDLFEGGPRDASSFYEKSTCELRCWAASAFGKDIFPWFDNWATQYANFLTLSVDKQYKNALAWGDQQGDDGGKVNYWHRGPLCLLLAGLGYDTDDKLLSLGKKLSHKTLEYGNPSTIYPLGGVGVQYVLDPGKWMDTPHKDQDDGIIVANGIGLIGYRIGRHFTQGTPFRTVRADRSPIPMEDHHYVLPPDYDTWVIDGIRVVAHPMGYGIGGNEFFNLNSFGMKNDGSSWTQELLGIRVLPDGFETEHRWYGPFERYHHALEPVEQSPAPGEYAGCEVISKRKFVGGDDPRLTIARQWKSPGNTFPRGTESLPAFQEVRHALGAMTLHEEDVLTWEVSGVKVFLRFSMWDGENKIIPNLVIETEPRLLDSQNYWRTFIQAPKDLFNGALLLTYSISKVPDVPDVPPPPIVIPPDPEPEPEPIPPVNDNKLLASYGGGKYRAYEKELVVIEKTVPRD